MRPLAHWTGRRLLTLWALGLVVEAALLAAPTLLNRRQRAQWEAEHPARARPPALSPAQQDSLAALAFAMLRAEQTPGSTADSALQALRAGPPPLRARSAASRESVYRALDVPRQLTPAQRDSLGQLSLQAFGRAFAGLAQDLEQHRVALWSLIAAALAVYSAIPVALLVVTLLWWRARRRQRRSTAPAAALYDREEPSR